MTHESGFEMQDFSGAMQAVRRMASRASVVPRESLVRLFFIGFLNRGNATRRVIPTTLDTKMVCPCNMSLAKSTNQRTHFQNKAATGHILRVLLYATPHIRGMPFARLATPVGKKKQREMRGSRSKGKGRKAKSAALSPAPFPCSLCEKAFSTSLQLGDHLNRHNGVKPK